MAHDRSLGTESSSEPSEELLMKQVEQLATQIIKTKEKAAAEEKKPGAAALLAGMNPLAALFDPPACSTASGSTEFSGVNF